MAAKKKTKKKQARSKKVAGKKMVRKGALAKKKTTKKKPAQKKAELRAKAVARKAAGGKTAGAVKKRIPKDDQTVPFPRERSRPRSGGQSGDLQGLSNVERADSESVDELLEEGNAFEADVVSGVEDADNADEKEVRTHEVPEDDVPGEYLDKD